MGRGKGKCVSDMESGEGWGFSEAQAAAGLVFCSGVIGIEADGSVPADAARQFELAFAALGGVLARQGCAPADLVDLTSFHVGYPAHMEAFMAAKAAFMAGATCCWTAIGAAALGYPGSLVEIKAVARAPEPRRAPQEARA